MREPSNEGFPDSFGPDESLLQAVITSQIQDWMRGERNPVDSYLDRHPDLRARPSAILDLLYQEVILREMAGETPRPEDYQGRYDGLVESISRLFEVHRALRTTSIPAGQRDRPTDPDEIALEGLPGYDIEGILGRGGMGVVYLARHRGLNRRVALKMLHSGSHARPEQRERFLREAEAVAKCQHPNLVQIFEVGEHSGSPFLALEYVDGGSLAQALAGLPQTPQRSAWLVEILAGAIDHAHLKGVVHRDLKPSNVLMTIDGAPKITDFGLAKLLDDSVTRTEDGAILGTASYMAPEQASGGSSPIGPAADIYALGAILYECLTGRPPFQDQTVLAALERVRSQPPLAPSKLRPKLPDDIETICLKCLEKEPGNRYGDAAALADDLRRFQEGRTILAKPASVGQKVARWSRRNPWVAAFMALLILAVIATSSLAYWAIRAENSAKASAREAVARSEITEAVGEFVRKDLLSQASVFNHARGGATPDPDLKVRTALDRASSTIGGRFQGRPRVEAAIQHTIGETYLELGLYEQARVHLQRALDLRRKELGESHPETLASMYSLGTLFSADGKTAEAEALLVPAQERFRVVLGNKHPETLQAMAAVAEVRFEQEKYDDCERLLIEALNGFRAVKGEEDPQTLGAANDLANLYCATRKNLEQARELLLRVVEISTRRDGPEHPQTLLSQSTLAGVYDMLGKIPESQQLYGEVVPKLKKVLGANHPNTLGAMALLAEMDIRLQKYDEAERLLTEALAASRTMLDRKHIVTDLILSNLASVYTYTRQLEKIGPVLMEALEITKFRMGPDHSLTAGANGAVAAYYMYYKRYPEAEPYIREVLRYRTTLKPDALGRYDAESYLGACLTGQRKFEEAERVLLSSYQGLKSLDADPSPERKGALKRLLERMVQLHEAKDDATSAATWRARLDALNSAK